MKNSETRATLYQRRAQFFVQSSRTRSCENSLIPSPRIRWTRNKYREHRCFFFERWCFSPIFSNYLAQFVLYILAWILPESWNRIFEITHVTKSYEKVFIQLTTIDVISDRRVLESFPFFFTFLLGNIHIPYFAMHLEARHSFWVHVWMGNGKNVNSGNFSPLKNARSGDLIYRKARRHGQRLKRLLDLRLIYRRIWRDRFSLLWKIGATSLTKFYVLQFHHFVSP